MMSFRGGKLAEWGVPASLVWLLSDIAEAKGKEQLFTRQSPQVLNALRSMALIQSTESSNRIEGVTVDRDRLRPLVIGNSKPRDRSEEEVQNYRDALRLIHDENRTLSITPETILRLHGTIQSGAGDAGQFKRSDNQIVEIRPGVAPIVRFEPVSAKRTPEAVAELCIAYRHTSDQRQAPPLVALGSLVLDFLCIHPFRDGNGRVSRLLTLLGLYHADLQVGRYISLERLTEESKDDYYDVLRRSSTGWHDGTHDPMPWMSFFVSIVRRAYTEFQTRVGEVKQAPGAKTALVRAAVERVSGEFTLRHLIDTCPGVSQDMIRRVLKQMQREGQVRCLGRGPSAKWIKKGNTLKRGQ